VRISALLIFGQIILGSSTIFQTLFMYLFLFSFSLFSIAFGAGWGAKSHTLRNNSMVDTYTQTNMPDSIRSYPIFTGLQVDDFEQTSNSQRITRDSQAAGFDQELLNQSFGLGTESPRNSVYFRNERTTTSSSSLGSQQQALAVLPRSLDAQVLSPRASATGFSQFGGSTSHRNSENNIFNTWGSLRSSSTTAPLEGSQRGSIISVPTALQDKLLAEQLPNKTS
jgi:hypothetical protein